jgi:hypothetical protein
MIIGQWLESALRVIDLFAAIELLCSGWSRILSP